MMWQVFLSRHVAIVRYYVRLATFLGGIATASFWGMIVSVVMSCVGKSKDINWVVARSFHAVVAPLVGIRFTVEGEEHLDEARPAVVIGNHQTMLDILCQSSPPLPPFPSFSFSSWAATSRRASEPRALRWATRAEWGRTEHER